MTQRYCNNCGCGINPGDRFCQNCGTPLVESADIEIDNDVDEYTQRESYDPRTSYNPQGYNNRHSGETTINYDDEHTEFSADYDDGYAEDDDYTETRIGPGYDQRGNGAYGGYGNGGYGNGGYGNNSYGNGRYGNGGYGNNRPGNDDGKKKTIVIIVCVLAVLLIAGIIAFVMISKNKAEEQRLQFEQDSIAQVEKQIADSLEAARIYQERTDSLWQNFSTPSLKALQLKGFVKTCGLSNKYGQKFIFEFSTDGTLRSAMYYNNNGGYPATIDFSSERQPKRLYASYGDFNSTTDVEKIFHDEYIFTYSGDGYISAITEKADSWEWGGNYTFRFSNFDAQGLPQSYNYTEKDIDLGVTTESSGSITIGYATFDNNGNWTTAKLNGSLTEITTVEAAEEGTDPVTTKTINYTNTLTRNIIYYNRDQVNFDSYLR